VTLALRSLDSSSSARESTVFKFITTRSVVGDDAVDIGFCL